MNNLRCPRCGLSHIKKNGHTHYGQQNHACKRCGRQFVEDSQHIDDATRELIKKLLLERLSLSGICRVCDISMTWLLGFIAELYDQLPDDLCVKLIAPDSTIELRCLQAQADEMWSFVGRKTNKQWIWLAIDAVTRQVLAFHVGDRSAHSAQALWNRLPAIYREQATFYTDDWEAYRSVIPSAQHQICPKGSGRTNVIERFNCTLRQRVSRLVRKALSFSKKLDNHIGAIKYFICHYNLQLATRG